MNFSKVLENAELFLYQCCFFHFGVNPVKKFSLTETLC